MFVSTTFLGGCVKSKDYKKGLFLTSMIGEFHFVCVTLMFEQDTIIFCGEQSALYLTMNPNMDEQTFYKQCYESHITPITINQIQLKELNKNVFCLNDSNKQLLKQYENNIDVHRKSLLQKLNSETSYQATNSDLLTIYLCWKHNIIFSTEDESGYYWFTFELE